MYNVMNSKVTGERNCSKGIMLLFLSIILSLCIFGLSYAAGEMSGDITNDTNSFSVTLPTSLPLSVDSSGTVSASSSVAITNNGDSPIKISGIKISGQNGWSLTDYSSDFSKTKVNTKSVGLSIEGSAVPTNGTYDVSEMSSIGIGSSKTLQYNAVIPTQTATASSTNIANAIFTVSAVAVSSIAITTPPDKTEYEEGESFDPTGMVVTATFEDGSTATVSGYTYSSEAFSNGDITITISYGGKSTVQDIVVESVKNKTEALLYKGTATSPYSTVELNEGDMLNFLYYGDYYKVILPQGQYKLEVWGAQGGDCMYNYNSTGGLGGYSYGTLSLSDESNILYVYSGGQGSSTMPYNYTVISGGFNGGGSSGTYGGGSGGGASDFRLTNNSLSDRILVAGGGGGGANYSTTTVYYIGGYGGGANGGNGTGATGFSYYARGGSSTNGGAGGGYTKGDSGSFGVGGNAPSDSNQYNISGGGGGGWYGGGGGGYYNNWNSYQNYGSGGGGGSGYCSDILEDADTIGGNSTLFVDYNGDTYSSNGITGHSGNGVARITLISFELPEPPEPISGDYSLKFSSDSSFSIKARGTKFKGIVEYSYDKINWNEWTSPTSELYSIDNVIYLRGTNNKKISDSYYGGGFFSLTGTNISCSGNIENLLDYKTVYEGGHPPMDEYCFYMLFYQQTSLISAPDICSETLAPYCYQGMFWDCTNLVSAPEFLPALTLTEKCYMQMFYNCEKLENTPQLPATKMAIDCYNHMFAYCKTIKSPPALPSVNLATRCYIGMFDHCSSLLSVPALPATSLADNCYNGMFWGCLNIKFSESKKNNYTKAYRVPYSGTGTSASENDLKDMFVTGGDFIGTPTINTTYYLDTSNSIVSTTGSLLSLATPQLINETVPENEVVKLDMTNESEEIVIDNEVTEELPDNTQVQTKHHHSDNAETNETENVPFKEPDVYVDPIDMIEVDEEIEI